MTAPSTVQAASIGSALTRGTTMPSHMRVATLGGSMFDYADVWQRRNLLLVGLPPESPDDPDSAWLDALDAEREALEGYEAAVIVTRDEVPGLAAPGVVVADRWGEVTFVETARRTADLPSPATLGDWLKFVDHACPECEGEAR